MHFSRKISRNLTKNLDLQQNLANLDISCIFGSARFISLKIWLGSLLNQHTK